MLKYASLIVHIVVFISVILKILNGDYNLFKILFIAYYQMYYTVKYFCQPQSTCHIFYDLIIICTFVYLNLCKIQKRL